jgi:hypothetical protein
MQFESILFDRLRRWMASFVVILHRVCVGAIRCLRSLWAATRFVAGMPAPVAVIVV